MKSKIAVPVNSSNTITQWGVYDVRSHKILRTNLTRAKARNYARRSQFYRVVRRPVFIGLWDAN